MIVRSVSFDTSFLLKDSFLVDEAVKKLASDRIPCFVTTTVISELEQLKVWGRIDKKDYKKAMKRLRKTNYDVIDFKNRLLSDSFTKSCMVSMEEHHGVKPKDIVNDCNIIVKNLKNGVDVFLSEDFHFTSRITKQVVDEVSNLACKEYHLMCDTNLFSIDTKTFLDSYDDGSIDLRIVESHLKNIRKKGKRLGDTG